jgi:hypothetical protein
MTAISIDTALESLRAHGLHASARDSNTLFVAADVEDVSSDIAIAHDVTILLDKGPTWLAIFPAQGQCTFEVPGPLDDLTELVVSVYKDQREHGGPLHEAVMRRVPSCQRYLRGAIGSPAPAKAKIA